MDVILAHLVAAALSALALLAREALVFITVRAIMPPLGFYIAWHASGTADPAWMVAGLALIATMFLPFFTPGRAGWTILNPLITLAYLAHLGWMAVTA